MKLEDEIRQHKYSTPLQKAVINLIFTSNWVQHKQQEIFRKHGITLQQFNILRILKGQHPSGISGTEIKSRMLDRNSDVSRLLDRLASKSLIERKTCPVDKRASDIFITTEGLSLLEHLAKYDREIDSVVRLSNDEAELLSSLLDRARG